MRSEHGAGHAAKRAEVGAEIKKWVDITDALGAPHLRIFAGTLPSGVTLQQSVDWVVEAMKTGCDYSGRKGITLGIEDHSGVTQQADVCLEIMHRVNSPYAGINLDITHFVPTATADAYAQIEACIPYATNTHIREEFDDGSPDRSGSGMGDFLPRPVSRALCPRNTRGKKTRPRESRS